MSDREQLLTRFGDDLWSVARSLRFWGLETGTRMTVVRLRDGGLFVHSPVALDPETRRAVDALGPVRAIVAPSRFHHMFVPAWIEAYPDAHAFCCPGLETKRADVRWSGVLGDAPEPIWKEDLAQVFFGARSLENEVVFFHPKSRTMICADAVFNLATHPSWATRAVARAMRNREPGATILERVLMRKTRAAAREQVDRILAWDFERILLAHGAPILHGGREVLRKAYAWL